MIRAVSRFLLGSYRRLPRAIWGIFSIQVIVRGGDFVFPFLTLFLTRKLGLSGAAAGFWIAANVASGLAGILIAGKVGDHLGRKRVLAACMVGTGLLTALCGTLPPTLLIPRILVVAAFFQGAMRSVVSAAIMDLTTPTQRKDAFSLSYLGVNLGVAVGPMLAGFLFERHLHWIFFGNAMALAVGLVLLSLLVADGPAEVPGHEPLSERAVAGSALKAFFDRPLLVLFCVLSMFVNLVYAQTHFGLTLYTSVLFGPRGAEVFGLLMSLNAVVVLVTTTLLTRMTRRRSATGVMAVGTCFYVVGFAMLGFQLGLPLLLVSTVVWTVGEVLLAINSGAYLAEHTPRNFRGRFQSIRELMGSTGRLLSPIAFGSLITHAGIHVSWTVVSVVSAGCAGGFVVLSHLEHRMKDAAKKGASS